MTDRVRCFDPPPRSGIPEPISAIIEAKDRIIRKQTKRIEELESDLEQLKKERQLLHTKIASLLSSNAGDNGQQQQRTTRTVPVLPYGEVTHVGKNSFPSVTSGKSLPATSPDPPQCYIGPHFEHFHPKRNAADAENCGLAARTIQLAYRRYLMNKNFARLRSDVERSKRLIERTHVHGEIGDLGNEKLRPSGDYPEVVVVGNSKAGGLGTISEHGCESARIEDGSAQHYAIYPELSDSSDNESVLEMALEPAFDESSTNFEHLLEAAEVDGADDSFNSEGSQDGEGFSSRCSTLRAGNFGGFSQQWSSLTASFDSSDCNNQTTALRTRLSDAAFSDSDSGDVSAHLNLADTSSFESSSFDSGSQLSGDSLRFNATVGNFDFVRFCAPSYSPIWKRKGDRQGSTGSLQDTNLMHPNQTDGTGSLEMGDGFADAGQNTDETTHRVLLPDNVVVPTQNNEHCVCPVDIHRLRSPPHGAHPGVFHSIPYEVRCQHVLHQMNPYDRESFLQADQLRKRVYRIGLNLFNRKPERGIKYLIENKFIDLRPNAVARFLISRKGLSRQMIGEYLGNIQKPFNVEVLRYFAEEIDLVGLHVDVALRKYQSFFRMPGEAQKIERLMEVFACRYCACNADQVKSFRTPDTVFLLAFAIIMLNTDQHNKCIKDERRMKLRDFINNLRGIDDGRDVDPDLLAGIYDRVRSSEFKPASDHVTQVAKLEEMIVGKKPSLQLVSQHRRLVCYCRLYEIPDLSKLEKPGTHQRELFLFNDLLVVTKMMSKKRKSVLYSFRQAFLLHGVAVYLFDTPYYKYGVRLTDAARGKELITLCARTEHDRIKFVDDLKETILELEEMEVLESYESKKEQSCHPATTGLSRNHLTRQGSREVNRHSKDSGVADVDRLSHHRLSAGDCEERKNSISSSVFDFTERHRTESRISLDSGLASTSSNSTSSSGEPVKLRSHSASVAAACAREAASRKN